MSVVPSYKVCVRLRLAQSLPSIGCVRAVVDVECVGPKSGSRTLAVVYKAAVAVDERARFPGIVWSRTADDDFRALCDNCLASLEQVEWISVNGCSYAVVC